MMKRMIFLLALAGLSGASGLSLAAESCVTRNVRLPVVEVNDLHQEYDLPNTATTCVDGKCESHVTSVSHFSTEPRFEIVLAYKGDTFSYEAEEAPTGNTVPVTLQECGKHGARHSVKPAA